MPTPLTDDIHWVLCQPTGLVVGGVHDATPAPLHPAVSTDVWAKRETLRAAVLARPGGFDGRRAVLTRFDVEGSRLQLWTQERSYTEGLALRDVILAQREHSQGPAVWGPVCSHAHAERSWGLSLTTFVVLPGQLLLASQRGAGLTTDPGRWTVRHTEIVEPSDVASDMQGLLERLVAEELPALLGKGRHRWLGLGTRPLSHSWHLVSLLDLRECGRDVVQWLANLRPDAEAQAHAVVPLEDTAPRGEVARELLARFPLPREAACVDDLAFARSAAALPG